MLNIESISASGIVNDYNRRNITPDSIHKVNQGYLRLWIWNNKYICELYMGSDDGKLVPGTLIISAKGAYRNTNSPQDIADDMIKSNELTPVDFAMLSASEMGKLGGAVKSEAKINAAKENGKKGGRPKKAK